MKRIKKYLFLFCILVYVFFLLPVSGQVLYASQMNTNQVQINQISSNSTSSSIIDWNAVSNIIKILGGSLFAIVTALITFYKFWLEKDYDIENIEISLINKKLPQNIKYTEFICKRILSNEKVVEEKDFPNSYYLDISIKITTPNGRKTLNDIVIKEMIIDMNEYKIYCFPKDKKMGSSSKCPFNKQKEEERCEILLKWPTIKSKNDRIALNPATIFKNPDYLSINLVWYPSIIMSPIWGAIFPHKREIVFEKMKHENGSSRIGIKSKGIFKGKRVNG